MAAPADMNLDEYLDSLASAAPTPGGGSAAALVGATGAALVAMVGRITLRSTRYSSVHAEAAALVDHADRLRTEFRTAGLADESAYSAVVSAFRLPHATPTEQATRDSAKELALTDAAAAPLRIAELSGELAELTRTGLALGNSALESDLLCAVEFALACANAAAANVLINHRSMSSEATIAYQREKLWKACATCDECCAGVRASFVKVATE